MAIDSSQAGRDIFLITSAVIVLISSIVLAVMFCKDRREKEQKQENGGAQGNGHEYEQFAEDKSPKILPPVDEPH